MSGPKHLWSGDWEGESRRSAQEFSDRPLPVGTAPPQADPQPVVGQPQTDTAGEVQRPWHRRQLGIALGASLVAAAMTLTLMLTLGGGSTNNRRAIAATPNHGTPPGATVPSQAQPCVQNPSACSQATTTPYVTGPTANWMGMQIVTSPNGGVVVSTVRLGSPADAVGFEPGDQITQVDGHSITSVSQLRTATANLHIGSILTIRALRNSTVPVASSLPMTERPTISP